MIFPPPRNIVNPTRKIRRRDPRRSPVLNMAESDAQVDKLFTTPSPPGTPWGNLRLGPGPAGSGGGINIQGTGSCPLTQQLVLSGVTTCPGCIVYGNPVVTGCSLKWADGYDVNQTFCADRKYCDCDNETPGERYPPVLPPFQFTSTCCWRFIGELYTEPILHIYNIDPLSPEPVCDCTNDTILDRPGWLEATVCYDRIGKKYGIAVFVVSNVLAFSADICIFSATVDAMNCKDPIMSIDNDYTGCYAGYPAESLIGPFPTVPHSLAYGGTATLTPGGCPAPMGGFSAGFSSGFG